MLDGLILGLSHMDLMWDRVVHFRSCPLQMCSLQSWVVQRAGQDSGWGGCTVVHQMGTLKGSLWGGGYLEISECLWKFSAELKLELKTRQMPSLPFMVYNLCFKVLISTAHKHCAVVHFHGSFQPHVFSTDLWGRGTAIKQEAVVEGVFWKEGCVCTLSSKTLSTEVLNDAKFDNLVKVSCFFPLPIVSMGNIFQRGYCFPLIGKGAREIFRGQSLL